MAIVNLNAYDEYVEFITSHPTVEQVADFRLLDAVEARIRDLLEANRTRKLTAEEDTELDEYLRLEHIMRKAKLRALEKLGDYF